MVCNNLWISIHALREEGDGHPGLDFAHLLVISIHALREEGDHEVRISVPQLTGEFLSTPSARRATYRLPSFGVL